jgi:Methyltransferase FkbM domain
MTERPDRPVVLDFGMHKGEDTEFYLACGAHVLGFEANEMLVEHNRLRFGEAIEAGHLEIVSGAIVPPDFEGEEQTFYLDSQKTIWGTTSPQWADRNANLGSDVTAVTVPAIDLKSILRSLPAILYAKIDIEGADGFVLETFRHVEITPEFVSIESDKLDLDAVIREIETLKDLGYTRFAAVQQATVPGSYVRGTRFDGTALTYRFGKHASGPFGPYLKQAYKSADAVIDDYRAIFRAYARYGDRSWLMQRALSRNATRIVNFALIRALGKPLCGWYDTHAAR